RQQIKTPAAAMEASRHVNEDEQPKPAQTAGVGRSDVAAANHANRVGLATMCVSTKRVVA
ncbi:hypothetical protein KC334_g22278, partial [Hortaea werneckii]